MSETDVPVVRQEVFDLVHAERIRQAEQWDRNHEWGWGDCSSPAVETSTKLAVLVEEVGEVARAYLEVADPAELRRELVQVAAVAVAILEGELVA